MESKYKFLLMFTLFTLFTMYTIPTIVAQPVFKQNTNVTLSVPCTINGVVCSGGATCDGTVLNPDGDILYNDVVMTQNGAVFDLNLTDVDTSTNGEYQLSVSCTQGGKSSSKVLIFFVTPNGEIPTTAKGILYGALLFIFVLLFIIALYKGMEADSIVLKSALLLTAYLMLMGVTFMGWNLSADYLTSAPFLTSFFRVLWLILMYGLFPIIIILTFYTLWMLRQMDIIQNMIDKGMPVDEAYERTVKSGLGGSRKW